MIQLRKALQVTEHDIQSKPIALQGHTYIPLVWQTTTTVLGRIFKISMGRHCCVYYRA